MEKQKYRLLGTVKVPENKKAELNKYVLELLHKGGIRKSCEVVLDGKSFTVIKLAVPDENGIVQFDYSIFERKLRQVGFYDTNTCTLEVNDRGNAEYGLVVNMIMLLQEIYSENMCLLMRENVPAYPTGYLRILKGLLGVELFDDKRYRIWDVLFFLYQYGIKDIKATNILGGVRDNIFFYPEQTEAFMGSWLLGIYSEIDSRDIPKDEIAFVKSVERRKFLHKLLQEKLTTKDEQFEADLKVLLNSELGERQKMAARNDTIGMVAACSLYMLPAVIVGIYAGIKGLEFWDAWEVFGEHQYTDFLPTEKGDIEAKELEIHPFYQVIQREDENEFLEYWDGTNLVLSDKMKEYIEIWQKWYKETNDLQDVLMERELAVIAETVSNQYEAAYLDYDFVIEFLENKENENYQRAVKLFKRTKEKECWLFPELTVNQAYEWVVRYFQCAEDKIALRTYQALLQNKEQRMRLLGF